MLYLGHLNLQVEEQSKFLKIRKKRKQSKEKGKNTERKKIAPLHGW